MQDDLRSRLFVACAELVRRRGGFVSRDELVNFDFEGRRFPLIDHTRGIRNPRELDASLSIVSAQDGPYSDHVDDQGLLHYDFANGSANEGDNRKLTLAYKLQVPIILFWKPLPNVYIPTIGVYVIDVDERARRFVVATSGEIVRAAELAGTGWLVKQYRQRLVYERVHQPVFRARVLIAYDRTCAVCRLAHGELLDAAHIIPDSNELGTPAVTNGLALCKIHHSAYDQNFIGVDGSYRMHVNRDLLAERDGPMLLHGFQELNGSDIRTPRRAADLPSRDALEQRFAEFLRAR